MLLLLSILLTLAIQGDSDLMNRKKNIEIINPDSENKKIVSIEISADKLYREDQNTDVTYITESKTWIFNKETIFGY
jgi:hypothetical protein